ncbi:DnaD domain protein [Lactobacillus salivarius]|uniref:DnaD domain-containing protein n=1 Tax=Ligilactobacillus salivarius TaxID=1624 RepID=UPI0015C5D9B7|nr:DnaD domain protein [Ligilactobacillus salivarius]NXZ97136.1 DnaD domain protein [Ligilactobacillus salivarius]NYA58559.1 DnaD domain protein [Ligilactobacillus salivarius]NYA60676.1 DnaD domain protein [Ligilactobacillus salivarius]NYA63120.1 DnaD domain protein [Ligilactobacillus salivarius]NYA64814.1 DnaD domain protein [Ligilactobacillus salivarius]
MSNLLLDDRPLVIQPKLAELLGDLDEAVILQQIHYWLEKRLNIKDGYSWVYNSMVEWNKQFPWLSLKTLKRKFKSLEDKGLLITGNYNKAKFDRTKWYRINYDAFSNLSNALGQNDLTNVSNCPNAKGQNDTTNTIEYTENNNIDNTTTTTDTTEIKIICEFWKSNVGNLSPYLYREIRTIYNDWKEVSKQPKEMILESIKMAIEKDIQNISYIKSILKRWYDNRIYNVEDLKADQERFEKNKESKYNKQAKKGNAAGYDAKQWTYLSEEEEMRQFFGDKQKPRKKKKKSMFMDARDQDHSKSDEEAWEAFWNG